MNDTTMKDKNLKSINTDKTPSLSLNFPLLSDIYTEEQRATALDYNNKFKAFLNTSKTEREAVITTIALAKNNGFVNIDDKATLLAGDKVYKNIKNKGIVFAVIGNDIAKGAFKILGAHIDSPRLDFKPIPVYEDKELVYFKTHYYGGIKKYQWAAIPLAIHGVAYNQAGEQITINIGDKEDDPIFMITDLLPHLAKNQMKKSPAEIIPGENLNILAYSTPCDKDSKSRFKEGFLQYLNKTYGLRERDLVGAELSAVPATNSRDLGFDRLLTTSYGQDDKVCAYPSFTAVMDYDGKKYASTAVCILTDKEEVGSDGNSGANSRLYENVLKIIYSKVAGNFDSIAYESVIEKSAMLSSDVTNAFDPNFPSVSDDKNSNYLGHGFALMKYTGHGGKYNASDASSEFMSALLRCLDANKITWQTGELGKVDEGGGGTIAKCFANLGMDVIDCGVPVLSMHAPIEISHKYDVYETHRAYSTFLERF